MRAAASEGEGKGERKDDCWVGDGVGRKGRGAMLSVECDSKESAGAAMIPRPSSTYLEDEDVPKVPIASDLGKGSSIITLHDEVVCF